MSTSKSRPNRDALIIHAGEKYIRDRGDDPWIIKIMTDRYLAQQKAQRQRLADQVNGLGGRDDPLQAIANLKDKTSRQSVKDRRIDAKVKSRKR